MHAHARSTQWHTLIQWLYKHNSWLTFPLFHNFCYKHPFGPELSSVLSHLKQADSDMLYTGYLLIFVKQHQFTCSTQMAQILF